MAERAPRRVAVVVAGGDPPPRSVVAALPADAIVIGADSGVEHARRLGLTVDVAVGDFDSIDPAVLATTEAEGATVLRHPTDKDATDLELAIDTARTLGSDAVVVVGGHGGRTDHFVANALLLASARHRDLRIEAFLDTAHVVVLHGGGVVPSATVVGAPGDLVTLLAVGGPAGGIHTRGLQFALDDAVLAPGSTLGVSNVMLADEATVTVAHGTLLLIRPEVLRPDAIRPDVIQRDQRPRPTEGP